MAAIINNTVVNALTAAAAQRQEAWEELVASRERLGCPVEFHRAWEHVEEDAGQGDIARAREGILELRLWAEVGPLAGWIEACEAWEELRSEAEAVETRIE